MEQPATSIKAGFRTLLHNPKRMRGFTKAERVAIKKASESGVVQDVVRTFGSRLIPIVTGASGAGLGGTAAATVGSTASRGIGARIQMDKAQEVAELVASGGKARAKPSLTPQQTQRQATASLVAARSMPDLENNVEQPKAISAPKKSALFEKIRAQRAKAKSTPSNDENINILSGFLPKQSARRLAKLNSKSPNIKASKIFKEAAKENPEIFFKEDGRSRTISEVYNALTAGDF